MPLERDIRQLLQAFQEGYTRRDLGQVDAFMALFTADAEVIGTNGIRPGVGEWYSGREAARALVQGDWESWGDLRLDLDTASVQARGDVGWVAAYATVSKTIGGEEYAAFLEYTAERIQTSTLPAKQLLHDILRGGSNTVYELTRGERFLWPLRLTAVVVREGDAWRFAQLHFSYPTTHFPDERIVDEA